MSKGGSERVLRALRRLRSRLNKFERGEIPEIDIASCIDELSVVLGELVAECVARMDPTPLMSVIDYASDVCEGEVASFIFSMITLQLNAIASVISWAGEAEAPMEEFFSEIMNEDFVNFSADTTIKAIEKGNLDLALDIAISYLILGFYSAIARDEAGVDAAMDYFAYSGLKLDETNASKLLFKAHLYLSYLLIEEAVKHDDEFMRSLDRYKAGKVRGMEVAGTFYRMIRGRGDVTADAVGEKLARLIRRAIMTKNDWYVLRELRGFSWLYKKYASRYGSEIEDILYTLEGVIHAFSRSSDDIGLSEDVLRRGRLSREEREIVALVSSALKMYRLGLKEAFKNIVRGMRELASKRGHYRLSRIANILMRIDDESVITG